MDICCYHYFEVVREIFYGEDDVVNIPQELKEYYTGVCFPKKNGDWLEIHFPKRDGSVEVCPIVNMETDRVHEDIYRDYKDYGIWGSTDLLLDGLLLGINQSVVEKAWAGDDIRMEGEVALWVDALRAVHRAILRIDR